MNFKKFTDEELIKFINSTSNLDLLANAENEFLIRQRDDMSPWMIEEEDIDQDIMDEINKTWRQS